MRIRARISGSKTFADGTCDLYADPLTHCLVSLTLPHDKVHDGNMWSCDDESSNLGAEIGDHINLQFTTPVVTLGRVHAIFDSWASGAAIYTLREGQTGGGAGGGAADVYNRRRDKTDNPGFVFYKDNGVGTGGNLLINKPIGSGGGGNSQNSGNRDNDEWILNPETLYQIRLYATAAVIGYVFVIFYLHMDKT